MTDTTQDMPPKQTTRIRLVAMNFLARRDYSRQELAAKLVAKFPELDNETGVLNTVLDKLVAEGLLCDARFAGAFLRSRVTRGQGPYRIRQELQQRGVSEEVIERAFAEESCDWFDLARRTAQKKFGAEPPTDYRESARRARFLRYRGFNADQVQWGIGNSE